MKHDLGTLARLSPTALQDATRAVLAFGVSLEQSTQALQRASAAINRLNRTHKAGGPMGSARPWFRRERW
jgi:hypothetical protein